MSTRTKSKSKSVSANATATTDTSSIAVYIDGTTPNAKELAAIATSLNIEVRSHYGSAVTHIVSHMDTTNKNVLKAANVKTQVVVGAPWLKACEQAGTVVSDVSPFLLALNEREMPNALKTKRGWASTTRSGSVTVLEPKEERKMSKKVKVVAEPEPEIEEPEPVIGVPVSKPKMVTQIRKGRAVVDSECPLASSTHVFEDSDGIWDAMLNQTNINQNNNKFYLIQLLQKDSSKEYFVWRRWGRVGASGQRSLDAFSGSLDSAKDSFGKKFSDKTFNQWANRGKFVHKHGKYDLIQRDYGVADDDVAGPSASQEQVSIPESKLGERLQSLVSLIFDTKMMAKAMVQIGFDAERMPLGKLTKEHIKKGYEVLKQIAAVLQGDETGDLSFLSSRFYTLIPHNFGRNKPPVINTLIALKSKLQMVESLADIEIATQLISSASLNVSENPVDAYYRSLKAEIREVHPETLDWNVVSQYITNTHGSTHSNYKLKLEDLYRIERKEEHSLFAPHASIKKMLLWHGSRLTNFVGILSQGLRIAPPESPVTGYMFGKGIYFADMVSKSANYCDASKSSPTALLILSEVAVGQMHEFIRSDYDAPLAVKKASAHSSKGVGATFPDPSADLLVRFGSDGSIAKHDAADTDAVVVPIGTPKNDTKRGDLQYNEYIVYNTSQVRMRYLVKVRFEFKY